MGSVGRAVIRQPVDRIRSGVHRSEAMLDVRDQQILHVLAYDAFRGDMHQHFPAKAVDHKRHPHPLAVGTGDLEPV